MELTFDAFGFRVTYFEPLSPPPPGAGNCSFEFFVDQTIFVFYLEISFLLLLGGPTGTLFWGFILPF